MDPFHMEPFWKTKTLKALTRAEWELICDGCGRCCLHKLEYPDTGKVVYTRVACRLLDIQTGRCRQYPNRLSLMHDCLRLEPDTIGDFRWLPETCGYRLVAEGKDLPAWHPLISGDTETVHQAGMSLRGIAISERFVDLENLEAYSWYETDMRNLGD